MSQKCFNVLFSFIIRASLLFCLEKSKEKNKSLPTYLIFYQTESRNIFFLELIYKRNNLWYMLTPLFLLFSAVSINIFSME